MAAFEKIANNTLVATDLAISCEVVDENGVKAAFNFPMKVHPAAEAKALFDRDNEIRNFLAHSDKTNYEFQCSSKTDAIERLWKLGMFGEVYQVRAEGDFCFDND